MFKHDGLTLKFKLDNEFELVFLVSCISNLRNKVFLINVVF